MPDRRTRRATRAEAVDSAGASNPVAFGPCRLRERQGMTVALILVLVAIGSVVFHLVQPVVVDADRLELALHRPRR